MVQSSALPDRAIGRRHPSPSMSWLWRNGLRLQLQHRFCRFLLLYFFCANLVGVLAQRFRLKSSAAFDCQLVGRTHCDLAARQLVVNGVAPWKYSRQGGVPQAA